ncbi:unnamed protein product [Caenorhabditis angaria]|uniref:Alpha-tubulin N-acetyltransferase n=1 Tax=Caenorhabditis angaria TaxID=860376 RepID=A0A9P1J255_9PELO|nr:unnamed protein product [Caenorhabditis angaria]
MEIAFDLSTIFTDEIQRLDRAQLLRFDPRRYWAVAKSIDVLGQMSAKHQGLKRVITSYEKVVDSDEEQIVYLMWKKNENISSSSLLIGFLKVGIKKLYLTNKELNQFEDRPLCVLDFFIVPEEQRKGSGLKIFNKMLTTENHPADQCAYDRPSTGLQQFLLKNYGLEDPIWQTTKYVVFPDFFNGRLPTVVNTPRPTARNSRVSSQSASRVSSRNGSPIGRNRPRHDSVADLMRQDNAPGERREFDPNTPTGRKNTRDFGHTRIW